MTRARPRPGFVSGGSVFLAQLARIPADTQQARTAK